jgi:glycosyltransferase involved in cell wall biosynthesis
MSSPSEPRSESRFESRSYLILSQYYYPDVTAAAFRIKETVDILTARGHRVTVIAAEPHRGETGLSGPLDDGKAAVIRVPIRKTDGTGKWNYIRHYLSFMGNALWAGLTCRTRFDAVIATSPPLFTAIAGWCLSLWHQAPFILDIRDIWPDSAVTVGQIRRESLLYKMAKVVELVLYRKARLISCVAEPMGEYIHEVSRKKPLIIYNGIPESYLSPDPVAAARVASFFQPGKRHIVYVGNMGFCQNLDLVLTTAATLQQRGIDDLHFLLIGTGVERPQLEERVARERLHNVTIAGPVGKTDAIELIRRADALSLQLKADETMEKTIPSKVFDYLIGGVPILYGIKGEGARILEQVPGNIAFEPDSTEGFLHAVLQIREKYDILAKLAGENIRLVRERFLRERLVEKLDERIGRLLAKRPKN